MADNIEREDLIEEMALADSADRRRVQPFPLARTISLIGALAVLIASTGLGVSLRRSTPQLVLPAAFPGTAGLLGFWNGDATTLNATSGPNLAGSVGYVDGLSGKSFNLTAGTLSTSQLSPVSNAVSVMMWIKPVQDGRVMTLASRSTGPGMTSSLDDRHSFDLWLDPSGALVWETDDVGARVPEVLRASVPEIFDGNYHLVAATWDSNSFNVYMDAALVATKQSQGGSLNAANATPFRIGGPFPYTGILDELSVWSRVLTASEMTNYYVNCCVPHITATVNLGASTGPRGVGFDGSSIWVTNSYAGSVSKINPTTNAVITTVNIGGSPRGIAFDGSSIWVSNLNGTVVKIDPTTNAVIATVNVGGSPLGMTFDGTSIWIANAGIDTVQKVNVSTNAVTQVFGLCCYGYANPRSVAFDGEKIWTNNDLYGWLEILDPATNSRGYQGIGFNHVVQGIAFDGYNLWVTDLFPNGDSRVLRINPNVGVTGAIAGFSNPQSVTFDGTSIWIVDFGSNMVSRIDPNSATVTATVNVGCGPSAAAFDGTSLWVANECSGTVSKISV